MRLFTILSLSLLFATSLTSGCAPVSGPDKSLAGAVLGAGWGAGAGAVIGNQVNATGEGAAIGSGFGAVSGLLTGIGYDLEEGSALVQQRDLDALRVRVASNERTLLALQSTLDDRETGLRSASYMTQVFFDTDLAAIRLGTAEYLQHLASSIKQSPYVGHIEVHGYSDDTGDTERNQKLSEARARTVAAFLANQGISVDQITSVAHGSAQPLTTNATEVGRQLNRRVDIIVKK